MKHLKLALIAMFLIPAVVSAATLTEKFEEDYIPLGSATGTVSMAVADFDSDGKVDGIAAIDSNGGRVLAFSFSGPSQIWSVRTPQIKSGSSGGVIVSADLDGDGKSSDVVTGSKGIYAINSGTVMWEFPTTGSIFSMTAVDLNGDGNANEIVAGGNKIVYAVDSAGVSLWNFTGPSGTVGTISGIDLDKNGVPESVLFASGKIFYLVDSEGEIIWSRISSDNVHSIISADFDNDGYLTDVVVASANGNISALNSEREYLWNYEAYTSDDTKIKLYAADLSSTGIFDKIIVKADAVHALNSVGTRAWSNTHVGDVVAMVDFNGDGKMEGVVTGSSTKLYAISPTGQEAGYYIGGDDKKIDPYNVTGASTLIAGDLDGDGYLDDVFGVGNMGFFALAHTTDAPAAPATTSPPPTTVPPTPTEVTVNVGDDLTVTEGTVVTLTAEATPSLETGKITTYVWTEGTNLLTTDYNQKSLSKIFELGEHEIKVEVTDDTGARASDTVKVTVTAQASPTPQPTTTAPPVEEKQTSPLALVMLGIGIGMVAVGVVRYFMKKQGQEPEDDWA